MKTSRAEQSRAEQSRAELSPSRQRYDYIDAMKGIGILLVCLGHCITSTAYPLNRWLLSFHMPLFFFVSGMLLTKRFSYSFKTFLEKNFFSLVIPQITLAILGYLTDILIYVVILKKTPFSEISFTNRLLAWFLPTLFFMNMLLFLLSKIHLLDRFVRFVTLLLLIFLFFSLSSESGFVLQTLCATVFGLIGLYSFPLIKQWEKRKVLYGTGIMFLVICAILSYYNEPVKMFCNSYGYRPLFLLTAVIGIFSIFDLSQLLSKSSFLRYFGKHSIIVYVTHLPFLELFHRIYRYLITGSLENHGTYPHFLIMFVIVVILELCILPLVIKFCPIIFGIKRETLLRA